MAKGGGVKKMPKQAVVSGSSKPTNTVEGSSSTPVKGSSVKVAKVTPLLLKLFSKLGR